MGRLHLLAGELDLAEAVARRGLDGIRHDVLHAGRLRALLVEIELSRNNVDVAARHADALTELAEKAEHRPLLAQAELARPRPRRAWILTLPSPPSSRRGPTLPATNSRCCPGP